MFLEHGHIVLVSLAHSHVKVEHSRIPVMMRGVVEHHVEVFCSTLVKEFVKASLSKLIKVEKSIGFGVMIREFNSGRICFCTKKGHGPSSNHVSNGRWGASSNHVLNGRWGAQNLQDTLGFLG